MADKRSTLQATRTDGPNVVLGLELARLPEGLRDDERVALARVATALLDVCEAGGTHLSFLPRRHGGAQEAELSSALEVVDDLLERGLLRALVGVPGDVRPLIADGDRLYTERAFVVERELAGRIVAHTSSQVWRAAPNDDGAAIEDALQRVRSQWGQRSTSEDAPIGGVGPSPDSTRTASREAAVTLALSQPLSLLFNEPEVDPHEGHITIAWLVKAFLALGEPPEAIALTASTALAARHLAAKLEPLLGNETSGCLWGTEGRGLARPVSVRAFVEWDEASWKGHRQPGSTSTIRLLVVDAASALDGALASALLELVPPTTRVVFVGDPHLLPSPGPCALLLALVSAQGEGAGVVRASEGEPPSATSDHDGQHPLSDLTLGLTAPASNHEGPGAVRAVAAAVARGHWDALAARDGSSLVHIREGAAGLAFAGVERVDVEQDWDPLLERWLKTYAAEVSPPLVAIDVAGTRWDDALQEQVRRAVSSRCVLCVGRAGARGSVAFNTRMGALWGRGEAGRAGVGTPVRLVREDVRRGVRAGELGVIWTIDRGGAAPSKKMAIFPREGKPSVLLDAASAREALEPAWALSVAEARDLRFEDVLFVLPAKASPAFTRSLLYTAVTRAGRYVLLAGSWEPSLRASISSRQADTKLFERVGVRAKGERPSIGSGFSPSSA